MLSRFANIRNQGTAKCVVPMFQRATAIHTSSSFNAEDVTKMEYPPPTSKRDFVNFPKITPRNERPPVRLGFIPDSWFQFFYPKTGYTGPYVFMATFGTYLLSKEKLVVDEHFMTGISLILALTTLTVKFGPSLQQMFEKELQKECKILEDMQNAPKVEKLEKIKQLESNDDILKAIKESTVAKKEFVLMQMEIAYRERILETYKIIKNRLNCLAELENADRRNTHKNLVDFVLRNVDKAITPELEKSVLQNCISELNALAARA